MVKNGKVRSLVPLKVVGEGVEGVMGQVGAASGRFADSMG